MGIGRRLVAAGAGLLAAGAWTISFGSPPVLRPQSVFHVGWTSRGPVNISGTVLAIWASRANPSILLAGSGACLWRTTDGGSSWNAVTLFDGLSVSALAGDPSNPAVVYAGTGGGPQPGAGIFVSRDAGATWTALPSTAGYLSVTSLAISPSDPGVILFGGYAGVFRSTDRGSTWSQVLTPDLSYLSVNEVAFDPSGSGGALAVLEDSHGFTAYYSTDSGATWQPSAGLTTASQGISLAYAPQNPQVVYASVHSGVNGYAATGTIWYSQDSGHSFTPRNTMPGMMTCCLVNQLWVSPANTNQLVVAGILPYRSGDGGATVVQISDGNTFAGNPHADDHGIAADGAFDGSANRRLWMGTDGGIYRADDISTAGSSGGWSYPDQGLQTAEYYKIDAAADGRLLGGLQDIGVNTIPPGSDEAVRVAEGDVPWVALDPADESRFYMASGTGYLYRSDDAGGHFFNIFDPPSSEWAVGFGDSFQIDPSDPHRLFLALVSLWRSDNADAASPTFSSVRPPGSAPLCAFAIAAGDSNVQWLAQTDGKIYMTTNGLSASPGWMLVLTLAAGQANRIWIDPADASHVIVASRLVATGQGLLATTDGGATWSSLLGDYYDGRFTCVAVSPANPSWIYGGTPSGLLASGDGGAHWSAVAGPPGRTAVTDLVFRPGSSILEVATYGRGIWEFDTSVPPTLVHPVSPVLPAPAAPVTGR